LGRIIRHVDGEKHSLVPLKWLTKLFVIGDVISFLLQMGGGGIQGGGTLQLLNIGEKLIIVGLFAQIVFFGIFCCVAMTFHYRYTHHSGTLRASKKTTTWRRQMWALYGGAALIMFRSVFRVIEYLMGNNGYLLRHEVFLYIFDAVPMFIEMLLFWTVHPSQMMLEEVEQRNGYVMQQTAVV
jgi:hypothetical protein